MEKLNEYSLDSPNDLRELLDQAAREEWAYREDRLYSSGMMEVKHAMRDSNGNLEKTSWARVVVINSSPATTTVDLRPIDGEGLHMLLGREHSFTPVALFDFQRAKERDGLNFLTTQPRGLVLGRYCLPESVQLIYPSGNDHEPSSPSPNFALGETVAVSTAYL